MGCKVFDWPPEAVDMLRGCVAGRLSSGNTAKTLSRALDREVTRNAVIGKARSLGLTFDSLSAHNSKEQKRDRAACKLAPRKTAKPAPAPRSLSAPPPCQPAALAPELARMVELSEIAIPVTQRVTILGLRNSTCRFPVEREDDQWMFCGAHGSDFAAGRPYCPAHTKITTSRPPTPEERERHKQRVALMQAAKKMRVRAA